MTVFKAYDIRGRCGSEIDTSLAERIGRAFAAEVGPQRVVVGHDMRPAAPQMRDAVARGLAAAGVDVVDCGLVSTPMHTFAVGHGGFDGGIMVTASHNPAEYIGFKMCRAGAVPLSREEGIASMERRIGRGDLPPDAAAPGSRSEADFRDAYAGMVASRARFGRRLKVVADAANGMGGLELDLIRPRLDLRVVPLYFDLDGTFPNHDANPLDVGTLATLRETVRAERADLGVAFDGDGDRAAFVDERGGVVTNDLATALMAVDVLQRGRGAVVYDLRSSRVVAEEIERHGGTPIRSRVGHSFIKQVMRRESCVFGGEYSGHYYFPDNFNAESATLALVTVCNIVSGQPEPFSELLRPLRRYLQTGEVNFEVADKEEKMRAVAAAFPDAEVDRLDGVTVSYPDWWFNLRPSNTEPYLRLNLEAHDPSTFARARERVFALLGEPAA
ncbi:MAG: phosphomannomutase/phosphoglucomutase [Planctomycetota bacterium]